jgi:dipeptidyl aminopeptidase/acylaminoacyl peptidase
VTSTETWFGPGTARVESTVLDGGNQALVVSPTDAGPTPPPGVLWLHWLGHHRNDCTQFLPEAVALASRGVVSVLPQGSFPWTRRPAGSTADATEVAEELGRVRGALAHLRERTDPDRVAIVGHDYGAMYALALRDPDVRLVVAATPDSSWPHWFLTYWPRPGAVPEGYHEQLERFDPLTSAAALGPRLVLQWAEDDAFVPDHAPDLYAQAAPQATVHRYPYDHQLGDAAAADRLTALRDALDLD